MATRIPPKRAKNRKGAAPPTTQTNGNLDKAGPSNLVPLSMKVPAELRKEIGIFAREHNTNTTQLLIRGYGLMKEKLGG